MICSFSFKTRKFMVQNLTHLSVLYFNYLLRGLQTKIKLLFWLLSFIWPNKFTYTIYFKILCLSLYYWSFTSIHIFLPSMFYFFHPLPHQLCSRYHRRRILLTPSWLQKGWMWFNNKKLCLTIPYFFGLDKLALDIYKDIIYGSEKLKVEDNLFFYM